MTRDHDEFEGIDVSGPWGGVRIGSSGMRFGMVGGDWDEDPEVRAVRRKVRRRLDFLRQVAYFVAIVGGLALIDWATGGGWWVQWVAVIWGSFLALMALTTFGAPMLWGRDVEERMVEAELRKRRGNVTVMRRDDDLEGPPVPDQPQP